MDRTMMFKKLFWEITIVLALSSISATDPDALHDILGDVTLIGGEANLLCNTSMASERNPLILVIWYKDGGDPVYSFDLRGSGDVSRAKHWSDRHILGSRAYFFFNRDQNGRESKQFSILRIHDVQASDEGQYRCRVDFRGAPTKNSMVNLTVIVPPRSPVIYNEDGFEVTSTLGPFKEGTEAKVMCEVKGGRPPPSVYWLRSGLNVSEAVEWISQDGLKVTSEVTLVNLQRMDDGMLLTCVAQNNNVSRPVRKTVEVKMNLPPTAVWIHKKERHLLAGSPVEFQCSAVGSSPRTKFTWSLGPNNTIHEPGFVEDLSKNMSTFVVIPKFEDHDKELRCAVENPDLKDSTIFDSLIMEVHYTPVASLSLGSGLNASDIREGMDVFFECHVHARPPVELIAWHLDGRELKADHPNGVILSNRSLVIQKIRRHFSGMFTCSAKNVEGETLSQPIELRVKYSPVCVHKEPVILGVATMEEVQVVCDVMANPENLRKACCFHWSFNNSFVSKDNDAGSVLDHFISNGTRSVLTFSPASELDYGTVLCFANNDVGRQRDACVFQVVPAGRPQPLSNCSQQNHSTETLEVCCQPGYNGGLEQVFTMELFERGRSAEGPIRNLTQSAPCFKLGRLFRHDPTTIFEAYVYASNRKGRSDPVVLKVSSSVRRLSEKRLATIATGGTGDLINSLPDDSAEKISGVHQGPPSGHVSSSSKAELPSSSGLSLAIPMRTILFIIVSSVAIVIIVTVIIGVICKIQCQMSGIPSPGTSSDILVPTVQNSSMNSATVSTFMSNSGSRDAIGKTHTTSSSTGGSPASTRSLDQSQHHHHHIMPQQQEYLLRHSTFLDHTNCEVLPISVGGHQPLSTKFSTLQRPHLHNHHHHQQQQQLQRSQQKYLTMRPTPSSFKTGNSSGELGAKQQSQKEQGQSIPRSTSHSFQRQISHNQEPMSSTVVGDPSSSYTIPPPASSIFIANHPRPSKEDDQEYTEVDFETFPSPPTPITLHEHQQMPSSSSSPVRGGRKTVTFLTEVETIQKLLKEDASNPQTEPEEVDEMESRV